MRMKMAALFSSNLVSDVLMGTPVKIKKGMVQKADAVLHK